MYWRGTETIEGPQFEVTNTLNGSPSPLNKLLDRLFEDLWEAGREEDKRTIIICKPTLDASEVLQEL